MANPQKVMLAIRSSRPRFRNNHDKVAFVVHATFVASGYKLVATGRPALAVNALQSAPTRGEVEIKGWNECDEYAFIYVNPKRGPRKVIAMCVLIGENLLVDAVAEGRGREHARLFIEVEKYVTESREEEGDYDALFKNFDRLVTDLNNEILFKLDGSGGTAPAAITIETSTPKRNEEPEFEHYPPRPFPFYPQFVQPSLVVNRPDYSDLLPRGGSMLLGRQDLGMLNRFVDQIQPGLMGSPQPIAPPPGALYDPIGTGFDEPGRFGSGDREPSRSGENIHPVLEHFEHYEHFM